MTYEVPNSQSFWPFFNVLRNVNLRKAQLPVEHEKKKTKLLEMVEWQNGSPSESMWRLPLTPLHETSHVLEISYEMKHTTRTPFFYVKSFGRCGVRINSKNTKDFSCEVQFFCTKLLSFIFCSVQFRVFWTMWDWIWNMDGERRDALELCILAIAWSSSALVLISVEFTVLSSHQEWHFYGEFPMDLSLETTTEEN